MKKMLTLCLITTIMSGCGPYGNTYSRQVMRERLFNQCMELAAKMPRQSNDDVSDIVDSCDNSALSQSSSIRI